MHHSLPLTIDSNPNLIYDQRKRIHYYHHHKQFEHIELRFVLVYVTNLTTTLGMPKIVCSYYQPLIKIVVNTNHKLRSSQTLSIMSRLFYNFFLPLDFLKIIVENFSNNHGLPIETCNLISENINLKIDFTRKICFL